MKNLKNTWENTKAVGRGIKKTWDVTVGVAEAIAWGIALGVLGTVIYQSLKGNMSLTDLQFALVAFAFFSLTLRILIEGARYFREVGCADNHYKARK